MSCEICLQSREPVPTRNIFCFSYWLYYVLDCLKRKKKYKAKEQSILTCEKAKIIYKYVIFLCVFQNILLSLWLNRSPCSWFLGTCDPIKIKYPNLLWQLLFCLTNTLYYAKWNKPGGERQIPYDLTYKWNLINKTNKQVKKNQGYVNEEQTDSNQRRGGSNQRREGQ